MTFTLVYGKDLFHFPGLADQMMCDRGAVFKDRLGWDLTTDDAGRETDQYDALNPLYLILGDEAGDHVGSTRLMPTTGPTMIADHFSHLTDGVAIESPLIWETTRLFITRDNALGRRAAPALMWAGCRFALDSGIGFYVGVAPSAMVRVYSAGGWKPEVIGQHKGSDGEICACLWEVSEDVCADLADRAEIDQASTPLSVYRPHNRSPLFHPATVGTPANDTPPMRTAQIA